MRQPVSSVRFSKPTALSLTLDRLAQLRRRGVDLEIYSFPGTNHGMVEYTRAPDGSRSCGRITDGYFRLLADWISGRTSGGYGRARRR